MPEFAYTLRIPKDRIAVLIGTKGAGKRQLEKETHCELTVDSAEGVVNLEGKDALGLYVCREIVLAIGRGFSPDIAKFLLKPDYGIELLSIRDFAKNEGESIRLKGRVIGEAGKSRRTVEELTGVHITVYGKTIGLIGELEMLPIARKAVESLLSGQKHASVYHWLEQRRKELRKREFLGENA
ncbi:MAG TPA: KH domain-containing protein [Candidatus Binatia bacterium]|nr:KH domain-containing protein [Candidatus Binatia bacterium]